MMTIDRYPLGFLLGLTTLVVGLNAFKPLHIDDAAYYYYARQIAGKPLDPYGFSIFWYYQPEPANEVLAPPVLPYWWALAIRLFGEQPVLWKLWLTPFVYLFIHSLYLLSRRLAPGLERPLVVLLVLSPTILPGVNLMLDVPALALSLFSLTLYFRAGERNDARMAAVAGLFAGLAMQTKYTGALAPAAMLLWTACLGRWRLWPISAGIAATLFVGWEWFTYSRYGESHFRYALNANASTLQDKLDLLPVLPVIIGSSAGATLLLAVAGLVRTRKTLAVGLTASAILLAYLLVAVVPTDFVARLSWDEGLFGIYPVEDPLESLVFMPLGLLTLGLLLAVCYRLARFGLRTDAFLLLWFGLEVGGYVSLTPFPAVRRTMSLVVVSTLLACRLASLTVPRRLAWGIASFSAALGLCFAVLDWYETDLEKRAVERAQEVIGDGPETVWFTGHWGFQFYAERHGMKPLIPRYRADDAASELRAGDWLVVPDGHVHQQPFDQERASLEQVAIVDFRDRIPWRMNWCYYGGRTAIAHHEGPRLEVTIYRVTADFVPWAPR